MRLFKYVGSHVLDIVRDKRLKVTPPNAFDDPFEFCPELEDFSQTDLAVYIQEHMGQKEFVRRLLAKRVVRSATEAAKFWQDPATTLVCSVGLKRVAECHVQEHQERASQEFGVICFTENEEDLLMWSFYAANHTGALIEFDPGEIEKHCGQLLQVVYGSARPSFRPMAIAEDHRQYIRDTITHKSLLWASQREWRVLRPLDQRQQTSGSPEAYFCPISEQAILSVTFGAKWPNQTFVATCNEVRRSGHKIKCRKAHIATRGFRLEYNELT